MKLTIKQICCIGVILACFIGIFITSIQNNKLRNELNKERINNLEQIDSLTYINQQHLKTIQLYENEVLGLKSEVDSLNKIKNKIIIKKDEVIVSDNISSAVEQLKLNLNEKFNL